MLKDLYYKIVGKWKVFGSIETRATDRLIVYNWVLQEKLYGVLNRLWERTPIWDESLGGWRLCDPWGHGTFGFIPFIHVDEAMFKDAYSRWRWLDDDSRSDTTDIGFLRELVFGEGDSDRTGHLWNRLFHDQLEQAYYEALARVDGSAFDLGALRGEDPFYSFHATLAWNDRNTCMNRQYFEENY